MEFVDWGEGVSDRPDSGERFGEVLLDSEYLKSLNFRKLCVCGLRYVHSTEKIQKELFTQRLARIHEQEA